MAENDKYLHNRIENTALPYVTNSSIIEPRPHWVDGSNNALASSRGWMERRPGFPVFTADNLANPFTRFFTWQRWDGAFYVMATRLDGMGSVVLYKLKVGTDTTFQLIGTSAGADFDFVEANNNVYYCNGSIRLRYDGTTQYGWGTTGPKVYPYTPTAVTAGAGLVEAAIGVRYVYNYGNSSTGYLSDISDYSIAYTTPLQSWTVSVRGVTDAQIDKIHVYRTEDGGSVYLELPNSPIANPGNSVTTIVDNAADASLLQAYPAPFPGINGIPPLVIGFRYFAGRIWGFSGDTVYFSTQEECTTSVPEECWGQALTNSRSFGAQVMGLGVTPDFLLVFTTRGIYKIGGDSLNTFTISTLSRNMGLRNRMAVAEYDGKCAWLDTSNTIQVTDGYTIPKDDISLAIRPDIESIDHSQASMAAYATGKYKWLVLADGGAAKLRVFDLNMGQWNPPWAIASLGVCGSGQTAAGAFRLFIAKGNKPLVVNHSSYQDDGSSYTAALYTNLYPINKDNPTGVGVLDWIAVERNTVALTDVSYLTDEDFTSGTYTSIVANEVDPANRTPGTNLVEKWYGANTPAAQRVSMLLNWAAATTKFILYSLDCVYRRVN